MKNLLGLLLFTIPAASDAPEWIQVADDGTSVVLLDPELVELENGPS